MYELIALALRRSSLSVCFITLHIISSKRYLRNVRVCCVSLYAFLYENYLQPVRKTMLILGDRRYDVTCCGNLTRDGIKAAGTLNCHPYHNWHEFWAPSNSSKCQAICTRASVPAQTCPHKILPNFMIKPQ